MKTEFRFDYQNQNNDTTYNEFIKKLRKDNAPGYEAFITPGLEAGRALEAKRRADMEKYFYTFNIHGK